MRFDCQALRILPFSLELLGCELVVECQEDGLWHCVRCGGFSCPKHGRKTKDGLRLCQRCRTKKPKYCCEQHTRGAICGLLTNHPDGHIAWDPIAPGDRLRRWPRAAGLPGAGVLPDNLRSS
jgi:hypothetical protein